MKTELVAVELFCLNRKPGPKYGLEGSTLYTWRNELGEYTLDNSGGVFFSASPDEMEIHGVPCSESDDLFIMTVDGVFGVYDENLKLVREYKSVLDMGYIFDEFEDRLLA